VRRPVRRSQLISPWGVGAIVSFPRDESLMTCCLDTWPYPPAPGLGEFQVFEERLQARLRVDHFRLPLDYRIQQRGDRPGTGVRHANLKVPFVRFPLWHSCPRCGAMQELGPRSPERQRCHGPEFKGLSCHKLEPYRRPWLLPMRFIAACEQGHVQDFPFREWVHRGAVAGSGHQLRARAGLSSLLSGILIQCSCGESRTMAGAFNRDALKGIQKCGGVRPWLGELEHDPAKCPAELQTLQRGASNVYTPHVYSSIYLPTWGQEQKQEIIDLIENPRVWAQLTQGLVDGRIDPVRCQMVAEFHQVDAGDLLRAAERRRAGMPAVSTATDQTEEEYRQAEYQALRDGSGSDHVDFFARPRPTSAYGHTDLIPRFFRSVVLVHKLRETRALVGFSRIFPEDTRTVAEKRRELARDSGLNWLPAIVVRGEGIFLELKP
jgi:hypothetical protein